MLTTVLEDQLLNFENEIFAEFENKFVKTKIKILRIKH